MKLIFELPYNAFIETLDGDVDAERMWVEVLEIAGDNAYVGRLDSKPFALPMKRGMLMRFRPEHICEIYLIGEEKDAGTY